MKKFNLLCILSILLNLSAELNAADQKGLLGRGLSVAVDNFSASAAVQIGVVSLINLGKGAYKIIFPDQEVVLDTEKKIVEFKLNLIKDNVKGLSEYKNLVEDAFVEDQAALDKINEQYLDLLGKDGLLTANFYHNSNLAAIVHLLGIHESLRINKEIFETNMALHKETRANNSEKNRAEIRANYQSRLQKFANEQLDLEQQIVQKGAALFSAEELNREYGMQHESTENAFLPYLKSFFYPFPTTVDIQKAVDDQMSKLAIEFEQKLSAENDKQDEIKKLYQEKIENVLAEKRQKLSAISLRQQQADLNKLSSEAEKLKLQVIALENVRNKELAQPGIIQNQLEANTKAAALEGWNKFYTQMKQHENYDLKKSKKIALGLTVAIGGGTAFLWMGNVAVAIAHAIILQR